MASKQMKTDYTTQTVENFRTLENFRKLVKGRKDAVGELPTKPAEKQKVKAEIAQKPKQVKRSIQTSGNKYTEGGLIDDVTSMDQWKHKANENLTRRAREITRSKKFLDKKKRHEEYLAEVGLVDHGLHQRHEELAQDQAEREDEANSDLLIHERAGLSPEDQAKIPKLNETNNLSYAYLRAHGNNWTYDPHAYPAKYKLRLYRRFDTFDKDSDGKMQIDEVLYWADRMRSLCETNDEEVERVRDALEWYFTQYGLSKDGLNRENWCEAHMAMGAQVEERKKQGDPVPMEVLASSYFEVLDENDDRMITLPELKKMMNVFRVPEEAAYSFMEMADADNSGYLEPHEMHELFYKFWFSEHQNDDLDHIFAYKY